MLLLSDWSLQLGCNSKFLTRIQKQKLEMNSVYHNTGTSSESRVWKVRSAWSMHSMFDQTGKVVQRPYDKWFIATKTCQLQYSRK